MKLSIVAVTGMPCHGTETDRHTDMVTDHLTLV